ncbi:MAG: DNA mismatch repair endonuclease MutL, partial [Bacilli bacterium]|nr:DNA mismatch repair endonuclease MutL [Bacilli bacterium]
MANIIKLDQRTANLIAAGEVIERAASVVKELVENSIDADANFINITLYDSGLTEIIVNDNGSGMDPADAKLSIEPHATSKIKSGEDLFKIFTLGFRGEALPSIVSVSNFRLKTSVDGKRGFMLSLKGGEVINEALIAFPKGTEISVKNLFFNTPARLQHLQSPNIELSNIVDYVNRVALSRPDISFKLSNNDRVLLHTFGSGKLKEVIFKIYGEEVTKNMVEIFDKNSYFEVSGLVSKPSVSRSNKNHINILVNNRVIRNSKIISAVMEAYRERLVTGRFPIAVIKIEVDPSIIDVNVHPGKLEVRFSNEMELLEMIVHAISYTLQNSDLMVEVDSKSKDETYSILDEENIDFEEEDLDEDDEKIEDEIEEDIDDEYEIEEEKLVQEPTGQYHYQEAMFKEEDEEEIFSFKKDDFKQVVEEKVEEYVQEEYKLHQDYKDDIRVNKLPVMYYVGQLHGTYLLFQDENNMY